MKKIIALLLATAMLVSFAACSSKQEGTDADETEETEKTEHSVRDEHSLIAIETENYKVSCGMLSFFYLSGFYNMYTSYGQYFTSVGFDITKPLSEQAYSEKMSWHDYMMDITLSDIKNYLFVAEAGKAEGYLVDDLDSQIDEYIDATLASGGMEMNAYLNKLYGDALDEKDLRDAVELLLYALDYYEELGKREENAVTVEVCDAHFKANEKLYSKVDYLTYTVIANTSNTEDKEAAYSAAEKDAETLVATAKAEGVDGFKSWVSNYMKAQNSASSTPLSEEEINAQIESVLKGTKGASYTEGDPLCEWAYEEGRSVGDCQITDNGAGSYSVTLITATPYRDEEATKDVRHILLTPDSYGSEEEAYAKANEVLEEWKAGEMTAESFDKLADKYNDDGGSLYENVALGQMVAEFENWLFDPQRQVGDTDIVKTDYGYHIMYFEGEGLPLWQVEIRGELVNGALSDTLAQFTEKYSPSYKENSENLAKMSDKIPPEAMTSDSQNVY